MARAVKKPLGGVRGRVGDVIYRYMNGRTFISVYNDESIFLIHQILLKIEVNLALLLNLPKL